MKGFVVFAAFVVAFCVATVPPMKLVVLDANTASQSGALCLDGSPPSLYIATTTSRNWVLFIQGGGWCYTPQDCLTRSKGNLGSSRHLPPVIGEDEGTGIFDANATQNPFYDFNKVYFNYCDGASFSGNSMEPITVSGTRIFFRGSRILPQLLLLLSRQYNFNQAQQVLLTGCSAGGLSTYLHADTLSALMPASVKKFKAAPISGFFLDHSNVLGESVYPEQMKNVFYMQNCSDAVPQGCVKANPGQPHKCIMAQHVFEHITTPLFIQNSAYDSWSLLEIFTVQQPDSKSWQQCVFNMSSCSVDQIKTLNGVWNAEFLRLITQSNKFWSEGSGGFIDSEFSHCEGASSIWSHGYSIGGMRPNMAWWLWFNDARTTSRYIGCTLNEVAPYKCWDN